MIIEQLVVSPGSAIRYLNDSEKTLGYLIVTNRFTVQLRQSSTSRLASTQGITFDAVSLTIAPQAEWNVTIGTGVNSVYFSGASEWVVLNGWNAYLVAANETNLATQYANHLRFVSSDNQREKFSIIGSPTFMSRFVTPNINFTIEFAMCVNASAIPPVVPEVTFRPPSSCDATDLYFSCSSNPCWSPGTAFCTSLQTSFQCTCKPGYSGVLCQTEINECASAPCLNGGTCVDSINRWNCTCTSAWSGVICQTDVNECATQNGGCNLLSTCYNSIGSYNCTSFIVANSFVPIDPIIATTPTGFIFERLRPGQVLQVNISAVTQRLETIGFFAGPADDPKRFPITNANVVPVPPIVPVVCSASVRLIRVEWLTVLLDVM